MTTTSIHRLGLLAVAVWAGLSAPASAQVSTTANGPYLAMPAWSQKLTTNRFVILANWNGEAVLDRETGLVWERAPDPTRHEWVFAHFYCNQLTVGGRKGWRLPSLAELASLIDPSVAFPGPALPPGHPFSPGSSGIHWSASTGGSGPNAAWGMSFAAGDVGNFVRSGVFNVWCVRGGAGADGG